jgi:hypothetical protein
VEQRPDSSNLDTRLNKARSYLDKYIILRDDEDGHNIGLQKKVKIHIMAARQEDCITS